MNDPIKSNLQLFLETVLLGDLDAPVPEAAKWLDVAKRKGYVNFDLELTPAGAAKLRRLRETARR